MQKNTPRKRPGLLSRLRNIASSAKREQPDNEDLEKADNSSKNSENKPVVISDAFQEIDWDMSENLAIIPYFGKIGEVFEGRGFSDGSLGMDGTAYYHLAKAKVKGFVDDLKAAFEGEQKRLLTSIKGLKTVARNAKNEYKHTNRIIQRKSLHPRHFSLVLAWIYLIVAIVLVLADIPLAVKLVMVGFDLDFGDPPLTELMRQPIQVITGNWEPLIMALGIALSSIFFKILYDEFASGPLSRRATMFKSEPEIDPKNEQDKQSVMRSYRFRAMVKMIIFGLTLGTIIVLGLFRFKAMNADPDSPEYLGNSITQWAFILITLLFPVVSGVCFSMALDRFLNWGELNRARMALGKSRERYIQSQAELVGAKAQLGKIGIYIDWVCSVEFFRKYLDFLLSCYAIGYERGQMSPDSKMNHRGYFEMVSKMRRKIVSRQVFNSIKEANRSSEESILKIFDQLTQEDFALENTQKVSSHEEI